MSSSSSPAPRNAPHHPNVGDAATTTNSSESTAAHGGVLPIRLTSPPDPRPHRRATHDSADALPNTSDCSVLRNSICFRRDDSESFVDDGSSSSGGNFIEVINLRSMPSPSDFSISINDQLASRLFPTSNNSSDDGLGLGGAPLQRDLPDHWQASSSTATAGVPSGPVDESEEAYHAIKSLVEGGRNADDCGEQTMSRAINANKSSGSGSLSSSSGTSGSSKLWDRLESIGSSTHNNVLSQSSSNAESSPMTSRRQKRKLYVRRCANSVIVVVALAALSMSGIYFFRKFFGDIAKEQPQDLESGLLRYRKLPLGNRFDVPMEGVVPTAVPP
mmetsp:Transcript_40455/g.84650  ORF Transcript_40455/g.84650 Transcript_40455/m.84650 type:complete len:331 (-) Transcript_40455:771-1763(-)